MLSVRQAVLWLCCPLMLATQAPAQSLPGLPPDWDISVIIGEIGAHATRLGPALDRLNAKAWTDKGASETYASQLQSAKDQARSLAQDATALKANPEKLSALLEVYFRIHALEQLIGSLVDGARKYQDSAVAGDLASLAAENDGNRNRLQTYIITLATQREQECAVMDREAQRCRAAVATQPPPNALKRGGKK